MRNTLKSRLSAGQICVNGWLSIPSGYCAEIMARAGWDSLTVDLQHGVQDYASMVNCLQAIAVYQVTPLVRVPSNEPGIVGKVLDAGAWGVICPMVNTAAQARDFVAACLYPSSGLRSNGPNRAAAYGDARAPYQVFANSEVLVLAMIETSEAVSNLDSILSVEGLSGVYVGPSDLGLSLGLEPKFDREEAQVLDIYAQVVAETSRRGMVAGIHTVEPAYAARMAAMGFRLVTVASDASLLGKASREALNLTRESVEADTAVRSVVGG